jgi:serine phosphatase RsbU (regulator of sigma subunit)
LLNQQVQAVTAERQLEDASRMQQHSLSHKPPPIDGWELAGWTCQAASLGGAFHDWRMLHGGRVAVAIADACDGGVQGAMTAAALRAALPGYLESLSNPAEILARLHELLQTHGAGDQLAGLALALLSPATGDISLAWAGRPSALWLPADQPQSLLKPTTPLGLGDRLHQRTVALSARPGDVLVIYNRGFVEVSDEQGRPLNETALAHALHQARDRSPNELIDVLCDRQEAHALKPNRLDRSVVVIKRVR